MKKMNYTNNQTAFEYALYMIASSYFRKATCKSKLQEKNMLIQYKEQSKAKQYDMEDICIAYMDDLVKKYPEVVFDRDVQVHLKKNSDGTITILFMSKKIAISMHCIYKGGRSSICSKVWIKQNNAKESSSSCRKAA